MIIRFILFALLGSASFAGLGLLFGQFDWPTVITSMTMLPLSPWILLIAMCGLLCGYCACVIRKRSGLMQKTLGSVVGVAIVGTIAACYEISAGLAADNVIFIFLTYLGILFVTGMASLMLPLNS